ncbi:GAF domain-containing sensor histidine kinase [Halorussus pelagicus]|uniref:GAF domain-containing sensor histidine kinase n=1 Tax=Halorussus pelagicus TaxID=2505977 RepID=UPI000FFC6E44|nr:ATP-binding protein [Halorussus pelagicus]
MREYEEILNRMTDAFFALDDEWRFTYVNERAEGILRPAAASEVANDDLQGESIWETIPEAVDTRFYDKYHEAMAAQKAVNFEERYEPLDAWFDVHVYPSETGLSVYFRDISERKRLEADLRRRDEVFQRVYRVIADKSASFEEKIESLLAIGSDALDTDYGALSRVTDDEYVFEFAHPIDGEARPGDTQPLAETHCERAIVTEETLVAADITEDAPGLTDRAGYAEQGIKCYVGTPVLVDGDVYGTFCFYNDEPRRDPFSDWEITLVELMGNWVSYELEREWRETELSRQRDRFEEFADIISHDLRNPLNVAEGRLSLAREESDSEHLGVVADALGRIESIVEDTLTLAREGRTVSDTQSVSLADLATECWGMVESEAVEFTAADAGRIRADPDRLRRVFENLFRNAVEHGSPEASENTGEYDAPADRRSALTAEDRDAGVTTVRVGRLDGRGFYVEDDGQGIPDDERESVFDPGYTTSESGTGLGLAIVARIAEAHGWTVEITDGTGGGTRFQFENVEFV